MFTQCRGCGEIFGVAVDDLVASKANVRCSSCGAVFDALETLAEYRPQDGMDLILNENDSPPPLLNHEFKQSIVLEQRDEQSKVVSELSTGSDAIEPINEELVNIQPEFVAERVQKPKSKSSSIWILASLTLLGLLLWQGSSAIQQGVVQLPNGEVKDFICGKLNCYVSQKQSDINSIALVSRSIRQHPGRDNALIITAGIINSDTKTQLFPALEIKMSNLNGDIVAMRRFLPSEYLESEIIEVGMPSNTLIPVTLELQSPGKNAVTFEVGFSPTYGER